MSLLYVSDFFTEQLDARKRMGNELVFNYNFSKQTIRAFLDFLHGLRVTLDTVDLMRLIKFLHFEGKSDNSDFERNLLELLCTTLIEANLPSDNKLLIVMVCNSFDNFKGRLAEVRKLFTS